MNDDELKKLWQEQPLDGPSPSAEQLISAMQNKTTGFRRVVIARDFGELVACVVVIIIFGFFYYRAQSPISRLGDLIVIGSSIFIGFRLVYTRRKTPPAPPGATLVESLRAELNAVRAQSRLLGSVAWWYLFPLGLGIMLCTWGSLGNDVGGIVFNIIYSILVIALYVYIHRLNQKARAKQILPLEAQLQSLLHSAETGEPLNQTDVANLHPIALSMATAAHVKPAEFKVAFWQLALWAEIGFVGIWCFLAIDTTDWRGKERARPTNIHFEATNSYSIVARKVVDLINAHDYATLEKLYDAEMIKTFPPKVTSQFYSGIAESYGKIEMIEGPTGKGYEGWTAFQLYCERGQLTMSLALDDDGQISGIYFKPPKWTAAHAGLIIRRIFSWKHMLWLVLCIAGGLLEAWVLQKRTERCVGISSLGIHLNQGMNLIFWDEIKEVRIFRILNIRSLRLIQESGEKKIIPWTSLERHADLKTAVENYAPASHPIRKYLSVLKRN